MFTYYHTCLSCGTFPVETKSIGEYVAMGLEYGRNNNDDVQVPCPSCEKLAPRDYSVGNMPYIKVQGGDRYKTPKYQNDAKKDWYRSEVKHTKEVLEGKVAGIGRNPYSRMTSNNPEGVGFKKVSMETAKARAEGAKKMAAKTKDAMNAARKNS